VSGLSGQYATGVSWEPSVSAPSRRWRSRELGELAAALAAFQGEVTTIPKGASNPFFKSRYATLPAVVEAASPLLAKHGLSVSQFISREQDGDALVTWLLHKSGQYMADTMQLRPVKQDPQAQGSSVTYGRRYAYMSVLGLVADEDDDGNAASRSKGNGLAAPAEAPSEPQDASEGGTTLVSEGTLVELRKAYKAAGVDRKGYEAVVAEVGAKGKTTAELTEDQATWVVIKLSELAKQKGA